MEGVSRTYKGYDGYAPIFCYIVAEGYMFDRELRSGKQHCQKNTPDLDIVFKITERTIDCDSNHFLLSDIDVETYWTNLYEDPETTIFLHHDHGVSGQFHNELRIDRDCPIFAKLGMSKFC